MRTIPVLAAAALLAACLITTPATAHIQPACQPVLDHATKVSGEAKNMIAITKAAIQGGIKNPTPVNIQSLGPLIDILLKEWQKAWAASAAVVLCVSKN